MSVEHKCANLVLVEEGYVVSEKIACLVCYQPAGVKEPDMSIRGLALSADVLVVVEKDVVYLESELDRKL